MKLLRLCFFIVIGIALTFTLAANGQQESESEKNMRYAHVGVEGAPQTRFAVEFAQLVEERTDGRIKFTLFPNSQLGNVSEMIEGVRGGSIAIAHHDFASLSGIVPKLSVFSAPYVFRDPEHAVRASNPSTSPVLRELNEELIEKGGVRIIGSFYRGARQLTTTDFPVYTPSDVKGKKIRGVPNKIWMTMLEGMGAIPTPVEFPELATALMTGLVVGQENPLTNIKAAKLYEVQDYIMLTGHMQSVLCAFVNEEEWQSISEEDQKIIEETAYEMSERSLGWAKEADKTIIKELKDKGITIIGPEDGLDKKAFRRAVLKNVNNEFPEWTSLIEDIAKIK